MFPFALIIALGHLLLRALARSVLALPAAIRAIALGRIMLWIVVFTVVVRWGCFRAVDASRRRWAFAWYWQLAQMTGYPRLLDRLWRRELIASGPGFARLPAELAVYATLIAIWTSLFVGFAILVGALQRGFGPGGQAPRAWPPLALRPPGPTGLLLNLLAALRWIGLGMLVLFLLPPVIFPPGYPDGVQTMYLVTGVWAWLDRLRFPRPLDARAATLRHAALARGWSPVLPTSTWNRPLLTLAGLEILLVAVALVLLLGLLWLARQWRLGASTGDFLGSAHAVNHDSPAWTIWLLPVTISLALLGRLLWRLPNWAPDLLGGALFLYLVSWVVTLALWGGLYLRRDATAPPLIGMRHLRHEWRRVDHYLRYPHWFNPIIDHFPHTRLLPPTGWDVWWGLVTMSAVVALSGPLLILLGWIGARTGKRLLEGLAQ